MAEAKSAVAVTNGTKRLADAVRAAKIAAAQRTDIVVDIREADRARLEMFVDELQPIVDAVPSDDDLFDFTLSSGNQPRFWIDATAHVMMGRDRRTYRFVRETRLGRLTLAESPELRFIVDRVTDYIAERIVERDKALAAFDGLGTRLAQAERPQPTLTAPVSISSDDPLRLPARPPSTDFVIALSWLMIGIVVGVGLLMAIAASRGSPLF
ncbi:hypothetical protein [Aureimonas sp. AU20]|uniref:hypothetical protein n=1 Tax=Aureimonas sp. AU20 TaxID=1349819 RepID=UPI0007217885|nr:hypothetical protein [Aureimonas sp. AU20]ALN72717.1 hypothetical protein M673_08330 [Aureimonas sp. AU20]